MLKHDPATPSTVFQGRYDEAGPLYERSQAIREKVLDPGHPDVATSLHNRAGLLKAQVRAARTFPVDFARRPVDVVRVRQQPGGTVDELDESQTTF